MSPLKLVCVVGLCLWSAFVVWAIDVSVIAMSAGWSLSNGFRMENPLKIYHLGLYSIYIMPLFWAILLSSVEAGKK